MEITSKALGVFGEQLALSYLRNEGYKIILNNYACRVGEIDLIARQGESLVFVEVKTRASNAMGHPAESITFRKRRQIVKTAQYYLKSCRIDDIPCRFDVVSIFLSAQGLPEIDLIQDAFGEE